MSIRKIFTSVVVVLTIFWAVGLVAFVPTAQAVTLSSGDLIKASLPAVYYYGADGKRYVFPNEKTYMTWYSNFSSVRTITDGELATIPIGGNVTSRPGVKMGKITTDPKVYAIAANGTLRWVQTESLASCLYGANWASMIDDISDAFFVNYTVGAPIANCADFDPAAATAAAQSINVDKGLAGATTGGVLSVSLASDTPAAATVAAGASANFTKINISAGSQAVVIKSMYITRGGLSSNNDVSNIKIVNSIGATVGDVGSLGSNSKALITFIPTLTIAANSSESYWLRASIGIGAPSGNTISLGISAASDVVLEAGTATGAFPVVGNYMSIVVLADLGAANVGQDSPVVDSQPDAGDKRVLVNEFYVQSAASLLLGAADNLTVEAISVMESGSANTSDSAVIELYSLTEGRTLGTVSAWDANSRATFGNLALVIPKGGKHIFQVYLDVIGGSGTVIDTDITDGTDALVTVKGNTYGFYLTPDIVAPWTGEGIGNLLCAPATNCGQTVNAGIMNVSKAASSPATGNITQASEQALTTWDFEVRGESAKITKIVITPTLGGGIVPADLTNAKLVDESGATVAGPKALTVDATGAVCGFIGTCANFTETIIVPTGTHPFTFKIDVLASAPALGTLRADITAPNIDITATGLTTRDNVTISAAAANGNLQTILGVALNVTTLTLPAARSVAAGSQSFVWATASLDASASGEDVRVSSVTVTDNYNDDGIALDKLANSNDLTNMTVWADLTTAASSRGDEYETKVSNNVQPANNPAGLGALDTQATAITLSQTITVPKGTYVKLAIVADLSSLADPVDDHTLNITAVTATGKSTGNAPIVVPVGAGQLMTIAPWGTLTLTLDAGSPSKTLLISGYSKQTVGIFKLAADKIENLDLDQVLITDAGLGVTTNGAVAKTWYLYSSKRDDGGSTADPIASQSGTSTPLFILADNTVIIPANGSIVLTVKVDVAPVDGTTVQNTDTLQATFALAGDVQTTGKSSGAVILSTTAPVAATHDAYAATPTISLNASSPSGALVPSANSLLAIFNVTANADEISFEGLDGNYFQVEVASACGTATADETLTLKDQDGNVLDTTGVFDICASGSQTFVFATGTFAVPAGQTEKLYVYGDTTEISAAGNSIQLWLDDGIAGGIGWGINGADAVIDLANNYGEWDVLYRGGIYANALVKG